MEKILRERARLETTGVPKSTWRRLLQEGKAPKPVKLRPDGRAIGYRLSEIQEWIRTRETVA